MNTLDQQRPERTPAVWTGELVRQRLVEAIAIENRLPGDRRYTSTSAWPTTPLHEWTDVLHWTDARQRVWDSWERAKGADPSEVSRMEEAIDWLRWVPMGERRCLEAWARAAAKGLNVSRMVEIRRWSRSTFYRKRDHAAHTIAERLNSQGVVVR